MARGGYQPGAGRPKGSTKKPKLSDFLNEQDVKNLVDKALQLAREGNENMLKFILDHHFGKAVQPVSGDEDNPLAVKITGFKYVIPKDGIPN